MDLGPVEYLMLTFPGNKFNGQISKALGDLVESGTIRILDLTFIIKDPDGTTAAFEYDELEEVVGFDDIGGHADGLLRAEDLEMAAEALTPDSSALLMVWEDLWASDFQAAVIACGGEVITGERVPREIVQSAFAGPDG
jgi:YD repeat-containing protein